MTLRRIVLFAGSLGVLYFALLRRPVLTWGATSEEASARLPGDELLDDADGVSTRAVSIAAPASAGMLPMEPASLVMERKMLRGIKNRAEALAAAATA